MAPRMMAHGEGPCASGAIASSSAASSLIAGRAHVPRRLGRGLFVCVDLVRATARTQALTANAHELMLCVCVCSRAGRATDGPPLPPPLHRGPRHRRLLRRRASPAAAAAPTAAARQPRDRSASATIAVLNCAPSAAPTHEHAHRVSERYCGGHNKVSADARSRESLFSRRDILDVDGWQPSHTLSHIARSLSHSPH